MARDRRLKGWQAATLAIGGIAVLALLLVWLWFALPDTVAVGDRAMVVATAAAAVAALGSTGAAVLSLFAARDSARTAKDAHRAMVLHNRPTGHISTWTAEDMETTVDGVVAGERPADFGDAVKVLVTINEGPSGTGRVRAAKFEYSTPGASYPWQPITPGRMLLLKGVVSSGNPHHAIKASVNITAWSLTCVDVETGTPWIASSTEPEGWTSLVGRDLWFEPAND